MSGINQGVTYTATGAQTIVASGADTITMLGPGALTFGSSGSGLGNLITADAADTVVSGGLDTINLLASGALAFTGPNETVTAAAADTVVGGANGGETIITSGKGALVWGPTPPPPFSGFAKGSTFINTGGANTIVTQSVANQSGLLAQASADANSAAGPADTIFAGAAGGTYFLNGITEFVAGPSGASTVIGGPNSANLMFTGGAPILYFASAGSAATIDVQGGKTTIASGQSSATQSGQSSYSAGTVTAFAENGAVVDVMGPGSGSMFVAGSGTNTVDASGSTGYNTFFAGNGNSSLIGGSGADFPTAASGSIANLPAAANLFEAGSGSATMVGGAGANDFQFTSGLGGGTDLIQNWNSSDQLDFFRYLGNPIVSQAVSGGSTVITLADNTRITIAGITNLNPMQLHIG